MRVLVVGPKACKESAQRLAKSLGGTLCGDEYVNSRGYDVIFNYGRSSFLRNTDIPIINQPKAVRTCIDKIATFKVLKENNLPHVAFCTRKTDIPASWKVVAVRSKVDGKQNDGFDLFEQGCDYPKAPLYTEYFKHEWEYRVVVFMGKVVARYRKDSNNGVWNLTLMLSDGFEAVDEACVKAAKALGIDYVGFDVVENKRGKWMILEANSGPMLTDAVEAAIIKHFKSKKGK